MTNNSYLVSSMRFLSILLIGIFTTTLSFAENPNSNPILSSYITDTIKPAADPCQGEPFPAFTDLPTTTYTVTADAATGCAKLDFDRPRAPGAMVMQMSGPEPGSCQKPGAYTLVYKATNWCDESITGTINVMVKPASADPCQGEPFPAFVDLPTSAYTFTADASGCAKLAFDRPRASGAMVMQISGPEPGSCQKPGTYTLVFKATNWCDESITGTITVIVKGDPCQGEPFPAFTDLPTSAYTFTADASGCAKLAFDRPRASGAMVMQISGPEPGSCQKPGTYKLVFKATNWCDESITGTITVIVKGDPCQGEPFPAFTDLPTSAYTFTADASGCAKLDFDRPRASGAMVMQISGPEPGSCQKPGTYTLVFKATNWCDESVTGTVTVIVKPYIDPCTNDKEKPSIQCPKDVTVSIGCLETCGKATFGLATAKDNCDPSPNIRVDNQSGSCFPVGEKEVRYWATDKSGNESTCSFKIIVKQEDKKAPVITTCYPDVDLYVDCGLSCTALMAQVNPTAKDDCDPNPKVWCEVNGKTVDMRYCYPLGKTTVTCYAEDKSGNRTSCSFVVTTKVMDDYIAPVITCPKDFMVSLSDQETKLNKMCRKVIIPGIKVIDNCDPNPKVVCTVYNGTKDVVADENFCFMMGKTRVTCTATDKAGNKSSCAFWLTVMGYGDLVKAVDENSTTMALGNKDAKGIEKAVSENEEGLNQTNLNLPINKKLSHKEVTIYPNPISSFINVELPQFEGKNVTIQVLNAVGQQLYNTTLKSVSEQAYRFDMQEYPMGMYIIKVRVDGVQLVTKKVMKQ
jgi:HYR domain/Secretion system C-terminal sorting domain